MGFATGNTFSPVITDRPTRFSGLFRCHMCGFDWVHDGCHTMLVPRQPHIVHMCDQYSGPVKCPRCGGHNFDLSKIIHELPPLVVPPSSQKNELGLSVGCAKEFLKVLRGWLGGGDKRRSIRHANHPRMSRIGNSSQWRTIV